MSSLARDVSVRVSFRLQGGNDASSSGIRLVSGRATTVESHVGGPREEPVTGVEGTPKIYSVSLSEHGA